MEAGWLRRARGVGWVPRSPSRCRLLKIGDPAASASSDPMALPRASRKLRVLVVDDNKDAAETLGMLLETLGHEVHLAHDSARALDVRGQGHVRRLRPGHRLARLDGYALARGCGPRNPASAATFIALTATAARMTSTAATRPDSTTTW
jgi:CheY-like chemotaxis protein